MSKIDKTDINAQIAASIKNFSSLAKDEVTRERIIMEMPEYVRNKAQMISAHFLLPAGARVVDMGCETGEITYMLAALNPRAEVIGVDRDANAIEFARKTYRLPNLSFRVSDISLPDFENESLDGIINSNILHHVYSAADYDPHAVSDLLEKQVARLRVGGSMLVRDYIKPPDEEFVQLELPHEEGEGDDPADMSDAELLIHFSQTARPFNGGCEGFFIEELLPRRAGTRLFRLPHKWAKEFIHRKDYRAGWEKELKEEYTFFSWQDYRREFTRFGMRMFFSAPYWNPWVVENCFQGRFQLYSEEGEKLPPPPTNYFIVAQKIADKQSLIIEERRPSQKPVGDLQVMIVRDKKSGVLHELVKRPGEYCDVVPYRVTPDNRVVVYVRSGYPRPIVNAVSRGSPNLDGKKWSGHLVEPVTMDTVAMTDDIEDNRKMIFGYVESYAGLRPKAEGDWHVGATYFPSPDRIDEAIEPVFIEVENPQKTSWPINDDKDIAFTEPGSITELDAVDILLASQVGLLPDPRLEMHVYELLSRYEIPLPRWVGEVLPKTAGDPPPMVREPEQMLEALEPTEFETVSRAPIHLKPVKAVFVEEGKVGRSTRGLSSQDIEFIVTDEGVENIATVLPMSHAWDNSVLVALEPKILPVPNRVGGEGKGAMLDVPSFVLPRNVKSIQDAKEYIAGIFRVDAEQVAQLGESYFTHTGVTPQRVYPFVVAAPGNLESFTHWRYTNLKGIRRIIWGALFWGRFFHSVQLVKSVTRLHMMCGEQHSLNLHTSPINLRKRERSLSTEKVAVEAKNAGYAAPARVLGGRPSSPDFPSSRKGGAEMSPAAAAEAMKAAEAARDKQTEMWRAEQENTVESQLSRANKITQDLIEGLMAPRVGKRLTQSYSRALDDKDGALADIKMAPTTITHEFDRRVDEVAAQLKKKKMQTPPVVEPPDPAPAPPGRK